MEGLLRLSLLGVATVILLLLFFDAWLRRRPSKQAPTTVPPYLTYAQAKHEGPHELPHFSAEAEPWEMADPIAEEPTPATLQQSVATLADPNDLIAIHIYAKPGESFASYDLLQAIAATGMQFGPMNIFHYYQETPSGKIPLFSLASATEPGEFNLDALGDFSCVGLTLFMNLAPIADPEDAFAVFLDCAEQLAEDLGGELYSQHNLPLTPEVLMQYQAKIMQYHKSPMTL